MKSNAWLVLLAGGCLGLGFAAGWLAKPTDKTTVASTTNQSSATAVYYDHPAGVVRTESLTTIAPADADLKVRTSTLIWMKQHRQQVIFVPAFAGDSFNLELGLILGLTPSEMNQLDAAIQLTMRRLNELAIKAATSQVTADGKTLIVSVPSLPTEGGAVYADLLSQFQQILGPERYRLFNEVSGEGFDNSFDRFGANPVTYELSLQPNVNSPERPVFSFKRYSTDAVNRGGNTSSGAMDRTNIEQGLPVLAHFWPVDPGK